MFPISPTPSAGRRLIREILPIAVPETTSRTVSAIARGLDPQLCKNACNAATSGKGPTGKYRLSASRSGLPWEMAYISAASRDASSGVRVTSLP